MTGMKPRPLGPAGAGTSMISSGFFDAASISLAVWSHAIHTSSASIGSCMKSQLVDCGLTATFHRSRKLVHMLAASGVLKATTPVEPVKDGYR